jgi:glucokinase
VHDFAIGGGFAGVTADYLDLVRASARERAVLDYARGLEVRASGLGGEGPLIGAAALVLRPESVGGARSEPALVP